MKYFKDSPVSVISRVLNNPDEIIIELNPDTSLKDDFILAKNTELFKYLLCYNGNGTLSLKENTRGIKISISEKNVTLIYLYDMSTLNQVDSIFI
jgi:hypothetical protein